MNTPTWRIPARLNIPVKLVSNNYPQMNQIVQKIFNSALGKVQKKGIFQRG